MNIIAFRLPGGEIRIFNSTAPRPFVFENGTDGFAVAPFLPEKDAVIFPYGQPMDSIPQEVVAENASSVPESMTREEYGKYLESIQEFLSGAQDRKVVAARRRRISLNISADTIFRTFCRDCPDALVFFISSPEYGTWIGASPELLLERSNGRIRSMALAGTRKAGATRRWDLKNLNEQQIVTDYIHSVFTASGFNCKVGVRQTVKAGNIEHLMTPLSAMPTSDSNGISQLLKTLSPTPALAGFPKDEAVGIISRWEGDRLLYGGFCGPYRRNGDFRLNVILRCALLLPGEAVVFAGGGITALSVADEEWQETENKMKLFMRESW